MTLAPSAMVNGAVTAKSSGGKMKKFLTGLFATIIVAIGASTADAGTYVYTGTVDGTFNEQIGGVSYDKRGMRITFTTETSRLSDIYISEAIQIMVGMSECFPGQQCSQWGEYIDEYSSSPIVFGANGFSTEAAALGEICNGGRSSGYLTCNSSYTRSFYFSGKTLGGPVNYTLRISAIPEPATWGMMIIGFGATGSMVRAARRRNGLAA